MSVSLFDVPFPCILFRGLSLVLRAHDQIPASNWPSGHMIRSRPRIGRPYSAATAAGEGGMGGRKKGGGKNKTKTYLITQHIEEKKIKIRINKSRNLFKFVLVLLSASVERVVSPVCGIFLPRFCKWGRGVGYGGLTQVVANNSVFEYKGCGH